MCVNFTQFSQLLYITFVKTTHILERGVDKKCWTHQGFLPSPEFRAGSGFRRWVRGIALAERRGEGLWRWTPCCLCCLVVDSVSDKPRSLTLFVTHAIGNRPDSRKGHECESLPSKVYVFTSCPAAYLSTS